MLQPKSERLRAAKRFIEANDRLVDRSTPETQDAHASRWSALLDACGGDDDLARAEAAEVLADTKKVLS